jgi:hypothetical protein
MAKPADNDNAVAPIEGGPMRIYVFTSKSKKNLRAFTDDMSGGKLPQQFAPWRANGMIATKEEFPYRFARDQIEKSITDSGFQLWRLKLKSEEKEKAD